MSNTKSKSIPKEILRVLKSIKNKRARIVIEHIIKHGNITTEDLEKKYGYNHPPRAARDVREAGIPLETFSVKSSGGRTIAAYRFGDLSKVRKGKLKGRKVFPRKFKQGLYEEAEGRCAICNGEFESRYLQIDHKVPYGIAGENETIDTKDYMLVCGSCNRAKSWSCEHCANWLSDKSLAICMKCYWGNPRNYTHIALQEIRRLDIIWEGEEVEVYERLKKMAQEMDVEIPSYVKELIGKHLEGD